MAEISAKMHDKEVNIAFIFMKFEYNTSRVLKIDKDWVEVPLLSSYNWALDSTESTQPNTSMHTVW